MKIIYAQANGILAQLIPAPKFLATLGGTEEEKMIHMANKNIPTGTKYEITDADLSDRSFRNAWEYVAGDNEKTSEDLSLDDQLKYNKITQEEYDANAG
tara:strand:+ start:334 stop:630 length:297 start_codon:yes stop_codon:yes gene_type:complete